MAGGYENPDYVIKVIKDNDHRGIVEWAVTVERADGTEVEEWGCDPSLNNALIGVARIIRADQ